MTYAPDKGIEMTVPKAAPAYVKDVNLTEQKGLFTVYIHLRNGLLSLLIVKLTTTCFSLQDCDLIGFEATIVKLTTVTMTTTCFSPQEGPILQEKRALLERSPLHRAPQ